MSLKPIDSRASRFRLMSQRLDARRGGLAVVGRQSRQGSRGAGNAGKTSIACVTRLGYGRPVDEQNRPACGGFSDRVAPRSSVIGDLMHQMRFTRQVPRPDWDQEKNT